MALKPDDFDFISNFDTLWAVILGAVLATLGGFVATLMEHAMSRRARERNAALLFGEVLSTFKIILEVAGESRSVGDPYGPVTMRLLRSARREIDIYERNRERLFDLVDGALRARIHSNMVRLAMALEGVFDASRELGELEARLSTGSILEEAAANRRTELEERRNSGFDFVIEGGAQLAPIIAALEPAARQSFQGLAAIARGG